MMKRIIAAALILVLCLGALSGCGNSQLKQLCGTWQTQIDLGAKVRQRFAEVCPDMVDQVHIASFPVTLELVILKNGTYQMSLEGKSFESSMTALEQTLENNLRTFLEAEFANIISGGLTLDAVLTAAGSSIEQQMTEAYGTFLEDLPPILADALEVDGKFKINENQLHMSQAMHMEVSDRTFHVYEVTKTELKLTSGYFTELSYPLVFARVGK